MTRYLVLGARAPAALEICRGLAGQGHEVFSADSMSYPVTRWSRSVTAHYRLPPAALDQARYGKALAETVASVRADVVIPTCEEVFHLSMVRHYLPDTVNVFAGDIGKLRLLHDKFTFIRAAENCGVGTPETMLLRSRRRLEEARKWATGRDLVYKRVYSRFAEGTLVKPKRLEVDGIDPTPGSPWIVQEYIEGEENCCYAVAVGGRLTALSIYRPLYRVGRGAGIYFEAVASGPIEEFVRTFVEKHAFTGQISFDFIVSPKRGPFVIECNPRATSGVHLLPEDSDWQGIFDGTVTEIVRPEGIKAMIGSAMVAYGLKDAVLTGLGKWVSDYGSARDAIWSRHDPYPAVGQFVATVELMARALLRRQSALAATTADIEWNGMPADAL